MSYRDIPGRHAMEWIIRDALPSTPVGGVWVEVGVALGRGIAMMARTLIDAGRDDVRLYAVDPWGGYARNGEQQDSGQASPHGDWALFLEQMQRNAPEELRRIHVLRADSVNAAQCLRNEVVDLCVLDADHTYEAVRSDLDAWCPLIREGGTIGGDDHHETEFPGVGRACRERFGSDYEVRAEELDWPTWRRVRRS